MVSQGYFPILDCKIHFHHQPTAYEYCGLTRSQQPIRRILHFKPEFFNITGLTVYAEKQNKLSVATRKIPLFEQ
jgi:hypothetical protein